MAGSGRNLFLRPGIEYTSDEDIGAGGFGYIKKVTLRKPQRGHQLWDQHPTLPDTTIAALKTAKTKNGVDSLAREADLLNTLTHDHIIQLLHHQKTSTNQHELFLEYASEGDLAGWIPRHLNTPNYMHRVLLCFSKICAALFYLHNSKNMLHRDIKAENILVFPDQFKLADFGAAAKIGEKTDRLYGTFNTLAPEILRELVHGRAGHRHYLYSISADLMALGLTMIRAVTGGILPYESAYTTFQKQHGASSLPDWKYPYSRAFCKALVRNQILLTPFITQHRLISGAIPPLFLETLTQLIAHDPRTRPTHAQLQHSLSNILKPMVAPLSSDTPTVCLPSTEVDHSFSESDDSEAPEVPDMANALKSLNLEKPQSQIFSEAGSNNWESQPEANEPSAQSHPPTLALVFATQSPSVEERRICEPVSNEPSV